MLLLTIALYAQFELNPTELYNRGNEYYERGEYSEAIVAYEQVTMKISNSQVLYNLGNAYFKKSMLGKAILNYRRAHFLAPRDGDIMYNLGYVRNYRVDKMSPVASPFIQVLSKVLHYFSMVEARILATIFLVIASVILSFYIVYRRSIFGYVAIIGAVFFLFFFINWQTWVAERNGRHAVISAPEVSALSGPGEDYKEIIVVHDGAEVKVRETRGDYFLIQLPGGIGGWVPVDAVEEVF
jgi:hypothetical protein